MDLINQRQVVIDTLRTIYDPELPINIWDLGLIYGIDIDKNYNLTIIYTLTSPNCPAIDLIPMQIIESLEALALFNEVDLELVWEPTWSPAILSEEIRLELGI